MDERDQRTMRPTIHESAFVAATAQIWGDVEIGAGSSVWFGAVIRGDEGRIVIGENTNVQDNCVVHSDFGHSVLIGSGVTIGHGAVIRACQIGDGTMIGMNATIMSGVKIGNHCVVGANSLLTYRQEFEAGSLVLGVPAERVRGATKEEMQYSEIACDVYEGLVAGYREGKVEPYRRASQI
jgi:carbonic anhydrase/acetyltransferase-like protein (isoleucine patch superfamily)